MTAPPKFPETGDLPDRLSVEPHSPYYFENTRGIGIRFDGKDRPGDVIEYCVSEGWIRTGFRTGPGKFRMERGRYLTQTLKGVVEPYRK